jgi:hypothetical protein
MGGTKIRTQNSSFSSFPYTMEIILLAFVWRGFTKN